MRRHEGLVDLRVAPPLCNLSISPADFGPAGELIDRSYAQTRRWLAEGRRSGRDDVGVDATVHP